MFLWLRRVLGLPEYTTKSCPCEDCSCGCESATDATLDLLVKEEQEYQEVQNDYILSDEGQRVRDGLIAELSKAVKAKDEAKAEIIRAYFEMDDKSFVFNGAKFLESDD